MFVLAQEAGGLGNLSSLLPILLVGAVFWFLVIRPQRKRQQERAGMLSALSVGSEVVTIGGMFGEVEAMDDNWVDLLVSEDVVLRFARSAIGRIASDEDQQSIEAFASGESLADAQQDGQDDDWDGDSDGGDDDWSDDATTDGERTEP